MKTNIIFELFLNIFPRAMVHNQKGDIRAEVINCLLNKITH